MSQSNRQHQPEFLDLPDAALHQVLELSWLKHRLSLMSTDRKSVV